MFEIYERKSEEKTFFLFKKTDLLKEITKILEIQYVGQYIKFILN